MEVVRKNDETEPTTVNQPRDLKDLIVLLGDDSSSASCVCRDGARVLLIFVFIDLQKLLRDVPDAMERGSD